jgi:SNF2 family DNA or RNA helicase|nr:MAG TPA_asm: Chromatin remodeling complex ATPase [Caudoviricetes sp.]
MVYIEIAQPERLKPTSLSKLSAFVSFEYDSNLVSIIKSMGTRVYIPDKKTWEIPESAVPMLMSRLHDYDVLLRGEMRHETPESHAQLPSGFVFTTKPYKHQMEGVIYGLEHESFLLGDDQGLGKTKEIIDLAMCRKQTDGLKHCLIICGINGNKYNWADEVKIHSREDSWILGTRFTKRPPIKMIEGSTKDKMEDLNNVPHQFFWITNIETLRGGSFKEKQGKRTVIRFPIAEKIQELCDRGIIGMIAFDEAHKAKNPDSQQGKALLSIDCKGPKIPMSGTFVLNNPLDLYLPLRWSGFETHSFYAYKQHYCKMGGFGGKEIVGYKNLDELRSMVSKVMLRRVKGDVLDLPPKVHTIEWVDAYPEQKSLYKDVRYQVRDNIDKVKVHPDPLSEMLRLRQVTGYPGILSSTVTKSAKMDRMEELVEEEVSVGGKAIIFSNWSEMTNVIRHKLKKYNPAYITGEVGSVQRMEEKDRFQNDPNCKVMIGTIGALGTGFTLTAAQLVIFVDEPWNRGIKDQAEDRAHRIGTRGTVRIVTILTRDTVDEGVYNLVQKKGKMADLLVDGKVDGKNVDNVLSYLLTFGG